MPDSRTHEQRLQGAGSIKNAQRKVVASGQLFRKYLLHRCQEDFGRGWAAKDAATVAKASDDEVVKAANDNSGDGEAGE